MMETLSNNEIRMIRSLREKKFRDELGLFIVEGEKMVAELAASNLETVLTVHREEVGEKVMERISTCNTPSPVLAVVRKPAPAVHGATSYVLRTGSALTAFSHRRTAWRSSTPKWFRHRWVPSSVRSWYIAI